MEENAPISKRQIVCKVGILVSPAQHGEIQKALLPSCLSMLICHCLVSLCSAFYIIISAVPLHSLNHGFSLSHDLYYLTFRLISSAGRLLDLLIIIRYICGSFGKFLSFIKHRSIDPFCSMQIFHMQDFQVWSCMVDLQHCKITKIPMVGE